MSSLGCTPGRTGGTAGLRCEAGDFGWMFLLASFSWFSSVVLLFLRQTVKWRGVVHLQAWSIYIHAYALKTNWLWETTYTHCAHTSLERGLDNRIDLSVKTALLCTTRSTSHDWLCAILSNSSRHTNLTCVVISFRFWL